MQSGENSIIEARIHSHRSSYTKKF